MAAALPVCYDLAPTEHRPHGTVLQRALEHGRQIRVGLGIHD